MITITEKTLTGMTFVDLFAGLGGFRLALESLGATCVYSNEWEKPVQNVLFFRRISRQKQNFVRKGGVLSRLLPRTFCRG